METHALRNARHVGVGGGWGVLTWASGYNFPLFLVYPVDMPVYTFEKLEMSSFQLQDSKVEQSHSSKTT